MTEPTRREALNAADVFLTTLCTLLRDIEMESEDDTLVAYYQASVKGTDMCHRTAADMGMDPDDLNKVIGYLNRKTVGEDAYPEWMKRVRRDAKEAARRRRK